MLSFPAPAHQNTQKGQVQAIRAANRPAGSAPAPSAPGAAPNPAASNSEATTNQQILQAIERLQREMDEIVDRLKKLEGRLPEKKE